MINKEELKYKRTKDSEQKIEIKNPKYKRIFGKQE